jgi:DNA-binding transcriptional regulator LsrR (DeoR family)
MKTIKQLADELGVSKDKVKYQVGKLPGNYMVKIGNITHLTDDGSALLRDLLVGKSAGNTQEKGGEITRQLVEMLQHELNSKNTLITEQQQTIVGLLARLEDAQRSGMAAQALLGGTMQARLVDGVAQQDIEVAQPLSRWQRLRRAWKGE